MRLIPVALGVAVLCGACPAQSRYREKTDPPGPPPKTFLALPYAFHTEYMETGGGVGVATNGYFQESASFVLTAFASANGTVGGLFADRNVRLGAESRWFLDANLSYGKYGRMRAFVDGNPDYPNERAGSNESSHLNFVEGEGIDNFGELRFKYLLPIGHGRDTVVHPYVLDRGMLHENPSGGESWNPLETGRTTLSVQPFFRRIDIDSPLAPDGEITNGLEFRIRHRNTDFDLNPSRGSEQTIALLRDFGAFRSDGEWTRVEGEFAKYFPLGETDWFRQQVLALHLYVSDTPTWGDGGRPPYFAASRLGGYFRMRGFPIARFHDRSAIAYSAEYRVIPEWNPIDPHWLSWWQVSLFGEAGRVAPKFDLGELHEDMRYDVGIGIRGMSRRVLIRVDLAWSEEGGEMQLMIGHPF